MRSVITRARRVMGVFGAAALAAGGGVALNASAASAATTTVHTKAQLQAAWQNPATSDITLAADIATCGTMSRSSTTAVTVHGNGHALRSTCAGTMLRQTGVGAVGVFRLTLRDAMPNNDNLDGGNALDAPLAAVRVDHDLVENNSAYKGGAVHAKSLVIVSSRFVHNGNAIADEQIGSAGAVVAEGDVAVQNSTFADNVAYGEAGIVAKGTVTVTGSTFIDNGGRDGAMAVAAANATITSSTFTNNISYDAFPAPGGAVGVSGTLRVSHSTFTGNQGGIGDGGALGGPTIAVVDSVFSGNGTAEGRGGAIEGNDVAVTQSTFHHNGADGAGGAIHAEHSLLAVASTFDGNLTEVGGTPNPTGGAISGAPGASLAVVNSTLTGNSTDGSQGSAIYAAGPLRLQFDTIAGNPTNGDPHTLVAQIYGTVAATLMPVRGTLVSGGAPGSDCAIVTTSGGSNFDDDGTCGFTGTGDVSHGANPQLGALANNGGPTRTMLPAASSPLVNAVVGTCLALDQRGVARPRGSACDIGSVER